jgi:TPR repeat protein
MAEQSPVEAYRGACSQLREIQESYEEPRYLERIRKHLLVLQSSFERLRQASANSKDPAVWHALGNAYSSGMGMSRDREQSIKWLQQAADAGHTPAMVDLGRRLLNPKPPVDAVAAIQWFRKAAEQGDDGGMVWLGFSYREGDGVPCDYAEAVRWFTKAVEAGDTHSMIHVGRMYAGYMSSPAKALPWFLRAAEAGLTESYICLADLYANPKSELYNPAEAHKWYRVVAEHSEGTNSRALLSIARQHLDGLGVPCDVELAKLWLCRLLQAVPQKSSAHREATKLLEKLDDQFL